MKRRIERPYWIMAIFGFAATVALILSSYILSEGRGLSAPFGLGVGFMLNYYFFSLTFFVIFTIAAASHMRRVHRGRPHQWFWLSLLCYSIGSILGAGLFLVFVYSVLGKV